MRLLNQVRPPPLLIVQNTHRATSCPGKHSCEYRAACCLRIECVIAALRKGRCLALRNYFKIK